MVGISLTHQGQSTVGSEGHVDTQRRSGIKTQRRIGTGTQVRESDCLEALGKLDSRHNI